MELSIANISIDILTALLYMMVCAKGITAIYHNHLSFRDKAYITLFVIIGLLYIFQTILQVPTGMSSSPALWNVINGLHVFVAFSIVTLLSKNSRIHESTN